MEGGLPIDRFLGQVWFTIFLLLVILDGSSLFSFDLVQDANVTFAEIMHNMVGMVKVRLGVLRMSM
jgi:hypothetical protein